MAADKPRVVPGGDIGHHAKRYVLNLLSHVALVEDGFCRNAGIHFGQKKIKATEQTIEPIARHADGLSGFARHVLASASSSATMPERKHAMQASRSASGTFAQVV